jgi:four helix bundle protein
MGRCGCGKTMKPAIRHFRDLEVYRRAFAAAMKIYELTKSFPPEEKFALVDQIRRASRSVCSNWQAPPRRRAERCFVFMQ